MDNEIQLISDGDGLAVIGKPADVERFLATEGVPSKSLGLERLAPATGIGGAALQAGSVIAENSGRWVQITEESARLIKKFGLMESKGHQLGVVYAKGEAQGIKGIVQFAKAGPAKTLANPANLAGAGALMTQLAMQQAMDEITDYLATIDEKLDDVLRAQKDAVLADMIGVDLVLEEAMTIRAEVGRVSEVTWSKAQGASATIARTQAYALRQLDALAEKLERKSDMGDLADAAKEAEHKVLEWLAVLARCFQLQDAIAVLELDRVLDAAPDELDRHRVGLRIARKNRMDLISRSTERLVGRMHAAAATANTKVLLHPTRSPAVVRASNEVATDVHEFHDRLGIENERQSLDAKRWGDAAVEAKDKVLESGAEGLDTAMRLGAETRDRAKQATDKISTGLIGRVRRRRGDEAVGDDG